MSHACVGELLRGFRGPAALRADDYAAGVCAVFIDKTFRTQLILGDRLLPAMFED